MGITILNKTKTRLRVKESMLPTSGSPILGNGIDVTTLPEGHMSCAKCKEFRFECSLMGDSHRVECGCMGCGESYRLLFPLDVDLSSLGKGRMTCYRRPRGEPMNYIHKDKGMIIIHNSKKLCIGCEKCNTQVVIDLDTKSNLVVAQ